MCPTSLRLGEIRLGAGSLHLLFRKMLSQQERCCVDLWCWDKLVGLVVVGVESPMVEAVGVRKTMEWFVLEGT